MGRIHVDRRLAVSGSGSVPKIRQKDWILSAGALRRLLAWLNPDAAEASESYRQVHAKLVRFFQYRGCSAPEECADRTLDRAARRLDRGDELPGNPIQYLHGVAINVWREGLRESAAAPVPLTREPIVDPEEKSQADSDRDRRERRIACLEKCIRKLPAETRRLLLSYHAGEANIRRRQAMARELGVGIEVLRTRVYRIRRVVERCTRACLDRDVQ